MNDVENTSENKEEKVRNVMIPLAVVKPGVLEKSLTVASVAFYLMLVITYLTQGFFINYLFLEISLLMVVIMVLSKLYDMIYISNERYAAEFFNLGAVIGYSNKLLILQEDNLIQQFYGDEIRIRALNKEEKDSFYPQCTSILECLEKGECVCTIGIAKLPEYENMVLKPNNDRADEDLVIVDSDDEDDFSDDSDDSDDDWI